MENSLCSSGRKTCLRPHDGSTFITIVFWQKDMPAKKGPTPEPAR